MVKYYLTWDLTLPLSVLPFPHTSFSNPLLPMKGSPFLPRCLQILDLLFSPLGILLYHKAISYLNPNLFWQSKIAQDKNNYHPRKGSTFSFQFQPHLPVHTHLSSALLLKTPSMASVSMLAYLTRRGGQPGRNNQTFNNLPLQVQDRFWVRA